jgi:hypothetical protein
MAIRRHLRLTAVAALAAGAFFGAVAMGAGVEAAQAAIPP